MYKMEYDTSYSYLKRTVKYDVGIHLNTDEHGHKYIIINIYDLRDQQHRTTITQDRLDSMKIEIVNISSLFDALKQCFSGTNGSTVEFMDRSIIFTLVSDVSKRTFRID